MAYRLRIVAGPGEGSEVDLGEDEVTIGRAPENGLVVNDNNVSRVHAKFQLGAGDRVMVIDNGSRNGVYVNDRKVAQQPINPGDRVVIGQTVLELVSDARPGGSSARGAPARAPAARPVAPAARQMPRTAGNGQQVPTGAMPVARPAPGARPVGNGGPKSAAIVRAPGGQPVRQPPRPGQKPAGPAKAPLLPKPALFAVIGVAIVFIGFAVLSAFGGGGNAKKGGGSGIGGSATPRVAPTPPPIPLGLAGRDGDGEKCNKIAQQAMDQGDSNRDSGNLPKARQYFNTAVKADPTCLSASVRKNAVEDRIQEKVREYEKAGAQLYEAGDYLGAIGRWEIAVEFIGDPKDSRTTILKTKITQARALIQKQPQ